LSIAKRFTQKLKALIAIILLALWSAPSFAAYTSVTVFGDSYSDGGNSEMAVISFYKLWGDPFPQTGSNPKEPYFNYRFSNGYTFIEYMTYYLGLYDKEHFFNYAVGGASTLNIPEILNYYYQKNNNKLDPTGLYVLQLGQNDLERALTTPDVASTNIKNALRDLYNHGARKFLVINAINLGYTPPYKNANQADIVSVSTLCTNFNNLLATKINTLYFKNSIILFNFGELVRNGQINALNYGFTSAQDACLANGIACQNPDEYIFWDAIHLTGKAHEAIGNQLFLLTR
jgi:phospholipase/lecithinase/hemolysin